jgi:hypothetical protein
MTCSAAIRLRSHRHWPIADQAQTVPLQQQIVAQTLGAMGLAAMVLSAQMPIAGNNGLHARESKQPWGAPPA